MQHRRPRRGSRRQRSRQWRRPRPEADRVGSVFPIGNRRPEQTGFTDASIARRPARRTPRRRRAGLCAHPGRFRRASGLLPSHATIPRSAKPAERWRDDPSKEARLRQQLDHAKPSEAGSNTDAVPTQRVQGGCARTGETTHLPRGQKSRELHHDAPLVGHDRDGLTVDGAFEPPDQNHFGPAAVSRVRILTIPCSTH